MNPLYRGNCYGNITCHHWETGQSEANNLKFPEHLEEYIHSI